MEHYEEQCGRVWIQETTGYSWSATPGPVEYVLIDKDGHRLSVHPTLEVARRAAKRA